jgi:hypothetical protein
LRIGKTAKNWIGQHGSLDETKFQRLGKSETPELPNTSPLGNSHRFLMVHYPTPSGLRLLSYGHQNLVGLLNSGKSGQIWPSGINQDSDEILLWPPQKICIRKMPLTKSDFCWLLIRPIPIHGLVATDFWIQVKVLNCYGQLGYWIEIPALGPKMGLIMDSIAYLPSSSTPTETHNFGNHSNVYGRSRIELAWS